jgi:polyisoprenoid-binding protein YceI
MRKILVSLAAAAALVMPLGAQTPGAPQAAAGPNTWTVDSSHSTAAFSVRHMMVSTVRGTLGPVKGTIEFDGSSLSTLKADISIDVSAINTGVQARDNDLRSPNFFDVAKYPAATFKSTRVEPAGAGRFKLIGDLTMHGVTKEVTLDVEGPSPVVRTQNGQKLGASATTTLNRRDFNLQYNAAIEAGPVVSDEVKVTIDIEANKRG